MTALITTKRVTIFFMKWTINFIYDPIINNIGIDWYINGSIMTLKLEKFCQ